MILIAGGVVLLFLTRGRVMWEATSRTLQLLPLIFGADRHRDVAGHRQARPPDHPRRPTVASRLTARAAPGSILVSSTVRDLVQGKGFRFGPSRTLRLKGFDEKVRAAEVLWS
ncbi:hypothetical protein BH23CHL7_BH23CHL7_10450 [soil metagenome]